MSIGAGDAVFCNMLYLKVPPSLPRASTAGPTQDERAAGRSGPADQPPGRKASSQPGGRLLVLSSYQSRNREVPTLLLML